MIAFFRKWYILATLIAWASGVVFWEVLPLDRYPTFSLILDLLPFIAGAVLLATRGLRETSMWMVALSIYLVFLIPSGLFMYFADVTDHLNHPHELHQWINTQFWLSLALEGGFIALPFVLGFSAIIAYLNNRLFARFGSD